MIFRMIVRTAACIARSTLVLSMLVPLAAVPARADACDALAAKLIRTTGASLAGREGSLAVFRAADAERMSLDCGAPRRMAFLSREREPDRPYYALVGLAAGALAGAKPTDAEALAVRLHQDSLLTGLPQEGRVGPIVMRCATGDRLDGFSDGTLCRVAAARTPPLRRRAGLSGGRGPG